MMAPRLYDVDALTEDVSLQFNCTRSGIVPTVSFSLAIRLAIARCSRGSPRMHHVVSGSQAYCRANGSRN
jgi:hypothetical protein